MRISFDPLTLLPGTFFVHAVVFEPVKHAHCDFREHAAVFKVRSDRTGYGVAVLPPPEWGRANSTAACLSTRPVSTLRT